MVEFMTMSVIPAPITSPSNGSFASLIMWKQQQVSFAVMIIESLIYFVHCSIYFRPNNLWLQDQGTTADESWHAEKLLCSVSDLCTIIQLDQLEWC